MCELFGDGYEGFYLYVSNYLKINLYLDIYAFFIICGEMYLCSKTAIKL